MARIYLGLGSNIDAEANLRMAIGELQARYGKLDISRVYRSRAVGFEGPDFLNLVVGLSTADSPFEVQAQIEVIHGIAGRHRESKRFASRPLDIDLLLYDALVVNDPPLHVPRSDILEYGFVLRPLAELAPDLVHPLAGKTMAELWADSDQDALPLTEVDPIL